MYSLLIVQQPEKWQKSSLEFPAKGRQIGFDWLCFFAPGVGIFCIIPFHINPYANIGLPEIGFVFSKRPPIISDFDIRISDFPPEAG
jgi:hypothetical protein